MFWVTLKCISEVAITSISMRSPEVQGQVPCPLHRLGEIVLVLLLNDQMGAVNTERSPELRGNFSVLVIKQSILCDFTTVETRCRMKCYLNPRQRSKVNQFLPFNELI